MKDTPDNVLDHESGEGPTVVEEAEADPEAVPETLPKADESEAEPEPESDEDRALADLTHDELKELAESEGIAEEIDLRSKESIIDALGG